MIAKVQPHQKIPLADAFWRAVEKRPHCNVDLRIDAIPRIACPDQAVGHVASLHEQPGRFNDRVDAGELAPDGVPRLILVLESPHKDEFEKDAMQEAIGPANGPTGTNIRRQLLDILRAAGQDSPNRRVVLVNAIQYQCSLGIGTKHLRDFVFCEVWCNGGENDFKARLGHYYRGSAKGDLIVNACSKGGMKTPLRDLVRRAIDDVKTRTDGERPAKHLRTNHPSNWSRRKPFATPE